jgi:hypothetical protein
VGTRGTSTSTGVASSTSSSTSTIGTDGLPIPTPLSGPASAAGCPPVSYLASGTDQIINLFATQGGAIAVLSDKILLLAANGTVTTALPSPRENVAADFDGATLAVADKALVTLYGPSLTPLLTISPPDTCAGVALLAGGIVVCGPSVDWDRTFTTYSTTTGNLVNTSGQYTYDGIPMRHVPGASEFITTTLDLDPPSFALFDVGTSGAAVLFGQSAFEQAGVDTTFAFDANPAAHLVASNGALLALSGSTCNANSSNGVLAGACFAPDGQLGTLKTGENFIGMADDGAGHIFGVTSSSTFGYPPVTSCTSGCSVQRIDIGTRLITSQKQYTLADLSTIVAVAPNPTCGQVLVGYQVAIPTTSYVSSTTDYGYRIAALAY